jgi:uncharacterized radical SAM protein YgiQ
MPRTPIPQPEFLPMTRAQMERLGWDQLDVLLITGDAYVDHPSFGAALLGRWLVANGYRTGIVAQPRWDDTGKGGEGASRSGTAPDIAAMGRPRLFAGVTAGALDSMLAHYTAFRKKRSDDAYTPGGEAGARPNRASIIYANLVRRTFPGLPVVLGGVEASLRRVSHYDFWSDALRRSILLDAKATAVLYGMAEHSVLALADALEESLGPDGGAPDQASLAAILAAIPGAVWAARPEALAAIPDALELPSHEAILADPKLLVTATKLLERQAHQNRQTAVQRSGDRLAAVNPPGTGLEGDALDALYALPFTRRAHPSYREAIPAAKMIEGSLNIHRGCAGGCAFCTLALHQGRRIRSRSRRSVLAEAGRLAALDGFSGSISDVGGPSANMWGAHCAGDMAACVRPSCLTPRICKHFQVDQRAFVELLESVARVPGVRHVRVASGWRMDLGLADKESLKRLVRRFTGGQAKVAPEHMSKRVLRLMRKPGFAVFEEFLEVFSRESDRAGKEQYVVPYLMSAHPGCTEEDMRDLAGWLGARGWKPDQVQCFIPLPGTAAAAMHFAGTDMDGDPIHVAATDAERLRQHAILRPPGRGGRSERGPGSRKEGSRGPGSRKQEEPGPSGSKDEEKRPAKSGGAQAPRRETGGRQARADGASSAAGSPPARGRGGPPRRRGKG